MESASVLWLVGSIVSLVVGLLVGALFAVAAWRLFARSVLHRDAGPVVPPFFMIGPGIAALALLLLAFGLFREYMGWNVVGSNTGTAASAPDSDCDGESLVGAIGMLGICAWMAWRAFVRRRQVRSTAVEPVATLAGGVVMVEGVAEALPGAPVLRSPLSGVECLAVHATLTQPDSDGDDRIRFDHRSSTPFAVRDATGVVTIQPDGADYLLEQGLHWSRAGGLDGSPRWLAALAAAGVDEAAFPTVLQRNAARAGRATEADDAPAAGTGDAPRQALAFVAAVRTARSTPDLDTVRSSERLLGAGQHVAVMGRHDPATGRIAAGRGVALGIAPGSSAFTRRYASIRPLLGWIAGAVLAVAWLWYEGGC
ncbi:MAG: hypothetical protein AB7P21_30680 [Lautropia sp.]